MWRYNMENIESIYDLILKTKLEYYMSDVLKDINIIDFAILSSDVIYKTNVYNKMIDKYVYDLDRIGFGKAMEISSNNLIITNLSEESIIRNSLSVLRRWIIRCSGYMCVRKMAEENIVEGIDLYMKKYTLSDEIVDMNTLNSRLENIDEELLSSLRNSI
jgi:hypothetical protein